MNRARLRNIIDKSKGISKKETVGDPFDLFVKTMPTELDYYKNSDNYRLKAAWEAYGKPKNVLEAWYEGLIDVDRNKLVMPSIGYNEETDSYEYLNKGKDNDIVNKDIRVWENDTIPFVKELKNGGYIRQFDEELNCWMYLKGGKTQLKKEKNDKTYAEFIATLPPNLQLGNDGENGYRMRYAFDNSPNVWTFDDAKGKFINWNEEDLSWHGSSIFEPTGEFLKPSNHPTLWMEEAAYMSSKPKLIEGREDNGNPENYVVVPMTGKEKEDMDNFRSRFNLVKTDENDNPLKYWKYVPKQSTQAFKQGGQMNVIPEGALHAHKNHMEGAGEDFTNKGIPVIDNQGNQTAEIEREELILNKENTDKFEDLYKKFYSENISEKEKDELAIRAGKRLAKELIENTDDRVGLIEKEASK